ncbi:hypothetical protein MVQ18_10970, partial [Fusobacterium necrophorum]|nr:hypothetical protein [Fusobacterium necrophorum]MDK4517247.1 hypothetical protein [Fusobacterium necrophorum]MDK4525236.1 hypothetical protein [Fusobacterium necrophorum]
KSKISEIDFKIIILKALESRLIENKELFNLESIKFLKRLENLARNQGGEKMIIVHFYNNTEKVYSVYANSLEDVKENPK